jgi:hypothetical protein
VLDQIYASFQPPTYDEHLQIHQANVKTLRNFNSLIPNPVGPRAVTPGQTVPNVDVGFSTLGIVQYILEGFQYRIVQAQDYLDTFTKPAKRSVDLMVACMVDYDWWLHQGTATPTPLYVPSNAPVQVRTQLQVMERISILSLGQIHGFAPFDPLREVAFRAGKGATWSSLEFVKDAVMNHGCIGIKMYPPMGFAPYGNAAKSNSFWSGYQFPEWLSSDIAYNDGQPAKGLGQRMDDALDALYQWCADDRNQVPVMAHSAESNGLADQFKQLASAPYWELALAKYPKLRVSFGHLGDLSGSISTGKIPDTAQAFIDLFGVAPNAYGDSAFDAEILKYMAQLEERYKLAYAGGGPLPERLMYGTDWNLLMTTGDIDPYMASFVTIIDSLPGAATILDGHTVRDRFFGWNAAEYLGLKQGQPARMRIEAFYKANGIDVLKSPPPWMLKVDKAG